jgi:hypothetical protein
MASKALREPLLGSALGNGVYFLAISKVGLFAGGMNIKRLEAIFLTLISPFPTLNRDILSTLLILKTMLVSLYTICLALCSSGLVAASPVVGTSSTGLQSRSRAYTGLEALNIGSAFPPQPRSRQATRAAIIARAKANPRKRGPAPSVPAASCSYTFDANATPVAMFVNANWNGVIYHSLARRCWANADCLERCDDVDAGRTSRSGRMC